MAKGARKSRYRVLCLLTLFYVATIFVNLAFSKLHVSLKIHGFVYFTTYCITLVGLWNFDLDIAPMQVVNSFMDFEEKILQIKGE